MARSQAYWSANLYPDAGKPPRRGAPLKDLPTAAASRFRLAREGLQAIPGIVEQVRFMGALWRWTWEYAAAGRKICWLHVLKSGVGATFTLSRDEESRLLATPRLSTVIRHAILGGPMTGPVRWCSVELTDRRTVDAFVGCARRKAGWAAGDAAAAIAARRRSSSG